MPWAGGGLIWLLASRPVSRLALRPVRFPRIGLRAEEVRRFCQLVLLCHSVAGGSFSFRLVPRLVCSSRRASRGYSLRFASRPVLLINSIRRRLARRLAIPSRLAVCLSHCLFCSSFLGVLSLRFISPASRVPVSPARFVKQSVFSLFALAARLGGS